MNTEPRAALQLAISKAGSQTAFAEALGPSIRTGHVYHWLKRGRLPAEHCPTVEARWGVRCEDLRPDVLWGVLRGAADAAPAGVKAEVEVAHG